MHTPEGLSWNDVVHWVGMTPFQDGDPAASTTTGGTGGGDTTPASTAGTGGGMAPPDIDPTSKASQEARECYQRDKRHFAEMLAKADGPLRTTATGDEGPSPEGVRGHPRNTEFPLGEVVHAMAESSSGDSLESDKQPSGGREPDCARTVSAGRPSQPTQRGTHAVAHARQERSKAREAAKGATAATALAFSFYILSWQQSSSNWNIRLITEEAGINLRDEAVGGKGPLREMSAHLQDAEIRQLGLTHANAQPNRSHHWGGVQVCPLVVGAAGSRLAPLLGVPGSSELPRVLHGHLRQGPPSKASEQTTEPGGGATSSTDPAHQQQEWEPPLQAQQEQEEPRRSTLRGHPGAESCPSQKPGHLSPQAPVPKARG